MAFAGGLDAFEKVAETGAVVANWKGLEQLTNNVEFVKNADKEFPEYLPINENEEQRRVRKFVTRECGLFVVEIEKARLRAAMETAYVQKVCVSSTKFYG